MKLTLSTGNWRNSIIRAKRGHLSAPVGSPGPTAGASDAFLMQDNWARRSLDGWSGRDVAQNSISGRHLKLKGQPCHRL